MTETAAKGNAYVRANLACLGLSVADLARKSGLNYQTLIAAVLGYRPPSPHVREQTAKALDLSVDELWGTQDD